MMQRKNSNRKFRPLRYEQLEQRWLLDGSALRITELMASNDDTLLDYQGDSSDWLEIYNPSATAVDLAGLYLTDDSDELTQWQFPAGSSIEPGRFLVVFASNKDLVAPNGELHTNFAESAGGEYLGLIAADGQTVIDEYSPEFPPQVEDVSYGLTMESLSSTLLAEGTTARAWVPTSGVYDATWTEVLFDDSVFDIQGATGFGYEDLPTGNPNYLGEYNTAVPSGTSGLYVRVPFEVSSLAGIDRLTLRMKFDDGFIAYLNGVEIESVNDPVTRAWNSTARSIHDDFDAIVFQEYDVSTAISSLVEGDNVLAIHALNFSAGSSDFLVVPELVASHTTIVSPEIVGYFDVPTPGYGNDESFAGFVAEPTFSVPHGFYTSPQQVALASDTPDTLIVYTTDGSTPAVNQNLTPINGLAYGGPFTVTSTTTVRAIGFKQDHKASFVRSSSYVFLDDVITQSPAGEAPVGWPDFDVNGQELDYGIDPEIVALYGEEAVKDSLASIPSITLTTDVENLFDANTGIYVNALNRGREWERAASVELIYPDGTEGFSTNAGLRIRGGYHRNDFNPKHAFRLYFRNDYGDGLLNYPLFGDEGVDEFDVLDLRTPQNYSWAAWGNTVNGLQNSYLREVFARDTQADLGQPYTRSRYYHLYVNGQYWGLYMTQERIQEHYGENYFGGDEADYDVVKSDPFESSGTEIADGNDVAWRQLFEMAQALFDNPTGAADNYWAMQGLNTDGTRNESLPVLLDVDNLIDYMMILFYTGGYDTGISAFFGNERANNWFGIRNRETADQGFQFFLHDNEHSMGAGELVGTLHGTLTIDRTGPFYGPYDDEFEYFNPVFLHQDLLVHPEYTQRFVDRVQELMFHDGPLTIDANMARMSERLDQVEPAIIAHAARWGDAKRTAPYTKADWDAEVAWLFDTYFPVRENIAIGYLQRDGLSNQFGAPVFSQFGGDVPYGYPLQLTGIQGTIYYSLDGATDPRQIGGGVNPSPEVQAYSEPIILTQDTTVWARLRETSGQWSGLVKATFSVGDLPGDYDDNGLVEQTDYDLWRTTYGSTTDLRADGNNDGRVNAADYTVWRNSSDQQATAVTSSGVSFSSNGDGAVEQVDDYNLGTTMVAAAPAVRTSSPRTVTSSATTEPATTESTLRSDVRQFAFALLSDGPADESEAPVGDAIRDAVLLDDLLLVHLTRPRTPVNAFDADSWNLDEQVRDAPEELLDTVVDHGIQETVTERIL